MSRCAARIKKFLSIAGSSRGSCYTAIQYSNENSAMKVHSHPAIRGIWGALISTACALTLVPWAQLAAMYSFTLSPQLAHAQPQVRIYGIGGIRGVLLAARFRSQHELKMMSEEDMRNTLIAELAARTKDDAVFYQSQNDNDLAGIGALLAYLRESGSISDNQIKTMTADEIRNTVITDIGSQTGRVQYLQALTNRQLANLVLSSDGYSYIRGVLLVGKFRSQRDLALMSSEDMRNTLISELAARTSDGVAFYQSLSNSNLAATGALLVYLRMNSSRSDEDLKGMSAEDIRNTVIVEASHKSKNVRYLQARDNMDILKELLGIEVFEEVPLGKPW